MKCEMNIVVACWVNDRRTKAAESAYARSSAVPVGSKRRGIFQRCFLPPAHAQKRLASYGDG
jgi:hypothetical protein